MRRVERHRNRCGDLHVVGPRARGSRARPASLRRGRNRVRDVDRETTAVVDRAVDQRIEVDTEGINSDRRGIRGIESEYDTGQEEQDSKRSPGSVRAEAGHTVFLVLRRAGSS